MGAARKTKGAVAVKTSGGAKKVAKDSIERAVDALPSKNLARLTFDPLEAKRAVNEGLKSIKRAEAVLKKSFPGFDLVALRELPTVCDRLRETQYALQQAGAVGTSPQLVASALTWRRKLLGLARTSAENGEVSAQALAKIEAGKGQTDNLQDVVALAELLKPLTAKVEAWLGKGSLAEATRTAQEALSAQGSAGGDSSELTLRRDRLATLIVQRHERLRAAVAAVTSMGEAVELVPSLSGRGAGRAPDSPPAPAPAPVS